MADRPLSVQEQAFVDAYVGPSMGNATDAARRAGYGGTDKTLATQGNRLLMRPQVKTALERRRGLILAETERRLAEEAAEIGGRAAEAILSAQECAVYLSSVIMGVATEPQAEGGEGPYRGKDRIAAVRELRALCGYSAPTRMEHSGVVGVDVSVTPEVDEALADWLLVRDDPRVQAVIAEMRGQ